MAPSPPPRPRSRSRSPSSSSSSSSPSSSTSPPPRKRPRTLHQPSHQQILRFHTALNAHLAAGATLHQAVRKLLPTNHHHSSAHSAPIFRALAENPSLQANVPAVAALLERFYPRTPLSPAPSFRVSQFADVAHLLRRAKNVVALVGAGVSVSCGIPDFRSAHGLYHSVATRFGLSDPQHIFCIQHFEDDPSMFFEFASQIMPQPHVKPSPTHRFLAELQARRRLLRLYSQNIDGLEKRAGVSEQRTVLCHGSFLTATCTSRTCKRRVKGTFIAPHVAAGRVPRCGKCRNSSDQHSGGVLKPDIVFFGEKLPDRVANCLESDIENADLLLVFGTSLQVAPVSRIPAMFYGHVPSVLVNRELVAGHFDVELLGDCDDVVAALRTELGWRDRGAVRDGAGGDDGADGAATAASASNVAYHFVPPKRFLFANVGSEGTRSDARPRQSDENESEESGRDDVTDEKHTG